MLAPSRLQKTGFFTQELQDAATSPLAFDRDLAIKIAKCIVVRRNFCGLSKQQLAARLGIDPVEVEAYEQGECPSSDELGHFVSVRKGGSGSSGCDVMPPADDAASGGLRWSGV